MGKKCLLGAGVRLAVVSVALGGCALSTGDADAVEITGFVLGFDEAQGCWTATEEVVAELPASEAICGDLTQCAIRPADGAPVRFPCTWGETLGWRRCPADVLDGRPFCPAP